MMTGSTSEQISGHSKDFEFRDELYFVEKEIVSIGHPPVFRAPGVHTHELDVTYIPAQNPNPLRANRFILVMPDRFQLPQWGIRSISGINCNVNHEEIVGPNGAIEYQFLHAEWEPVTISMYRFAGDEAFVQAIVNELHEPTRFDTIIQFLDEYGTVRSNCSLNGCIISEANLNMLDYANDELVEFNFTIRYNHAQYFA